LLTGCRVLVLEDEYFLAADLEQDLKAHGASVVGPFSDLSEAKAQVANGGFDVAIIDIDLQGQPAFPIADELMARDIPFGFATGYGPEILPLRFRGVAHWEKPLRTQALIQDLRPLWEVRKPAARSQCKSA